MNSVSAEEWRDIKGFEGLYQVSNTGKVRSLVGWNGHKYVKRDRELTPTMTSTGYLKVDLKNKGVKKSLKLHRVIAGAFIPNPDNHPVINHIDGNPLNNSLENLEWCSQKHNCQHAYDTGLHKRKAIPADIVNAYCEDEFASANSIGEEFGISKSSVCRILKHNGIQVRKAQSRYGIDIETIKDEFRNGCTNAELAQKYGCSNNLIARRRYQYRKGMI